MIPVLDEFSSYLRLYYQYTIEALMGERYPEGLSHFKFSADACLS